MKTPFLTSPIYRRLVAAFLIVTLLGALASSIGLWFSASSAQSINALQQRSNQLQNAQQLQKDWYNVVNTLDTLLLNRSLSTQENTLVLQVADFKSQVNTVASLIETFPAVSEQRRQDNLNLINDLRQIASDLDQVIGQVRLHAKGGRWGSALALRQTRIDELQKRLEQELTQLSQNIQAEVDESILSAQQAQNLTRTTWVVAGMAAVIISLVVTWFTGQRIVSPVQKLIGDVQRITQALSGASQSGESVEGGEQHWVQRSSILQPIAPLPQQDEIGDLSRAFALMTNWLRESYETLEKRVTERTQVLERRTQQVQAAAEVARDITGRDIAGSGLSHARGLEILLDNAVTLVRDRLGFYHAGIFLTDDRREYAILRAATGEAGAQMLAAGHRLKVGAAEAERWQPGAERPSEIRGAPTARPDADTAGAPKIGLVGYVCQSGQPRIALDVGQDAVHFKNPLLPETRSEVALPLKIGQRTIGALDVQSKAAQAFDEESIIILQVIADQLATAIENTRLLSELETRLQELENFYSGYGRQAWERFLQTSSLTGYEYDGITATPLADHAAHNPRAPHNGGNEQHPTGQHANTFPLELRGQKIGALEVWPRGHKLSDDEAKILSAISSRLSQILESSRLFQEAQLRAAREQTLNQLTASIVRAIDPQGVLQTATQELGRLPGIREVEIRLNEVRPQDRPDDDRSLLDSGGNQ